MWEILLHLHLSKFIGKIISEADSAPEGIIYIGDMIF